MDDFSTPRGRERTLLQRGPCRGERGEGREERGERRERGERERGEGKEERGKRRGESVRGSQSVYGHFSIYIEYWSVAHALSVFSSAQNSFAFLLVSDRKLRDEVRGFGQVGGIWTTNYAF